MKFSIIVPVYNGQETIGQCLDSLLNQNYPKKDYEIIVINDSSTDETKDILEKYAKRIRLVDLKRNVGKIVAREIGAKKAKYDILLFIDADCLARKDWLLQIKKANYQPMIGTSINDKKRSSVDHFFYLLRKKYYKQIKKPTFITKQNFNKIGKGTDNFVCSKKLFLESSPKKKDKTVSDDILLFSNILKKKKILKHPYVITTHLERTDKIKLFKQWFLRGITFADFYLNKTKKFSFILMGMLSLIFFLIILAFLKPVLAIFGLLLLFLVVIFATIYFSDTPKDFCVFLPYFIFVGIAFVLGVIRKKIKFFLLYFVGLIILLFFLI